MDSKGILDIVNRYISAVNAKFDLQKAFLFGSWAKGNPRDHSDIDVAIILSDYSDRFEVQLELMRLTRDIDTRIEPHPFKVSEFIRVDPLAYEVIKNGIEINISQQPTTSDMVAETQEPYTTK